MAQWILRDERVAPHGQEWYRRVGHLGLSFFPGALVWTLAENYMKPSETAIFSGKIRNFDLPLKQQLVEAERAAAAELRRHAVLVEGSDE